MSARPRVLVIDDEEVVRESCSRILTEDGIDVDGARSGADGLARVDRGAVDAVLLDLKMPGLSGMEVLQRLRESHPEIGVVVVTGYGTIETAVAAMKLGAFDYVCKPFAPQELSDVVRRLLEDRRAAAPEPDADARYRIDGIVGRSAAMQELYRLIAKVAPTGSNVLVQGESGTGKELVARAIHGNSLRKDKPFVPVDCSGFAETLLESELFGHVAGAFTGATGARKGLFEIASDGTLFLDEVANVPLGIQAKLLRVIQEREYRPVGDVRIVKTNFRLIAATNRDLAAMVERDAFREDLYYRLKVVTLAVPPLRDRRDDVPALAHHFLDRARHQQGRPVRRISAEAMGLLAAHDWPGNVRELANAIEGAAVLADGDTLLPEHLPADVRRGGGARPDGVPATERELIERKKELRAASVEEVERAFLLEALGKHGWNVTHAAEAVGMQRTHFQALMKKHGIRIHKPGTADLAT